MDTLIECALALLHNLLCCISVRPERASALRVRPHILGSGITIGAVQLVAIAAEAISALLKVDFADFQNRGDRVRSGLEAVMERLLDCQEDISDP